MTEDKEALKKDLRLILRMDEKLNYKDKDAVKMIYDAIQERKALTTKVGQRYVSRLEQILAGEENTKCIFCGEETNASSVICPQCIPKIQLKVKAEESVEKMISSIDKVNSSDIVSSGKKYAKKAVDDISKKVNEMAGGEGTVDLRVRDLFTDVFKRHSKEESEKIFICGTKYTTPKEENISTEWPKPWLYSRVAFFFFIGFYILMLCFTQFFNTNVIPGVIFLGSCMVPVSVLVFFFEVNAPRNISIFEIIKVFVWGGCASLFVTLLLDVFFDTGALDYFGAIMTGIVEEVGKMVIVAYYIKKHNGKRYILNGMLYGAAIGAGFAVFESAGYAMRYLLLSGGGLMSQFENMIELIYTRAILSPGGHIAWAAISGVAIVIVLGQQEFTWGFCTNKKFIGLFLIPVIMHAVWDMPIHLFSVGPFAIQHIVLILLVWIVILVLIHRGLEEINHS